MTASELLTGLFAACLIGLLGYQVLDLALMHRDLFGIGTARRALRARLAASGCDYKTEPAPGFDWWRLRLRRGRFCVAIEADRRGRSMPRAVWEWTDSENPIPLRDVITN